MTDVDETSSRNDVNETGLTVGAVARAVGISVRTLHHFDDIALVVPSDRTPAGYRLYGQADVARLQRVLVYRELGFELSRIRALIDDPGADEMAHLASQRDLLEDRIAHLRRMLGAVDEMMEAHRMNTHLTPQQQAEAFGSQWDDRYAAEAEQRWGHTPEWKESERNKASMTPEDFARARRAMEEIDEEMAAAKRAGIAPDDERALALAERHRTETISRWFEASHAQHALIARGYTEDPRFTAYYEEREPGLAAWLRHAIEANAAAHGVDVAQATWR